MTILPTSLTTLTTTSPMACFRRLSERPYVTTKLGSLTPPGDFQSAPFLDLWRLPMALRSEGSRSLRLSKARSRVQSERQQIVAPGAQTILPRHPDDEGV